MNLAFVTQRGYADLLDEHCYETGDYGDNGVLLKLTHVKRFHADDDGSWTFLFDGGDLVEVPYGDVHRGAVGPV